MNHSWPGNGFIEIEKRPADQGPSLVFLQFSSLMLKEGKKLVSFPGLGGTAQGETEGALQSLGIGAIALGQQTGGKGGGGLGENGIVQEDQRLGRYVRDVAADNAIVPGRRI